MLSFPPSTYEKTAFIKAALKKQASMSEQPIELIGRYLGLNLDFSLAQEPLQYDRAGRVTNTGVYKAMREALISNVCELRIKRAIFVNLLSDKSNISRRIFGTLLNEIRVSGYRVNLECVDLSYLNLVRLNFNEMNLKYADFSDSVIEGSTFKSADLSRADFSRTSLRRVSMVHAILNGSDWTGARLNQVNLYDAVGIDLSEAREVTSIWTDYKTLSEPFSDDLYQIIVQDPEDILSLGDQGKFNNRRCFCTIL